MPTPGPLELVIVLVIALVILGPGKLPDVGASLGKSIREFRKASSDLQDATTINVDTSPLPAQQAAAVQAPAAQVTPAVQAPAAQVTPAVQAPAEPAAAAVAPEVTTASTPVPAEAPAPSDDANARIAELERQLAEARAQQATAPVAAGSSTGGSESSS